MNPYDPPTAERGASPNDVASNPAQILLYIAGTVCLARGLMLIPEAIFELTLIVVGGAAIWLARQNFDSLIRSATITWAIVAALVFLIAVLVDPPTVLNAGTITVIGFAAVLIGTIAFIAFRMTPCNLPKQQTDSMGDVHNSFETSDEPSLMSATWSWVLLIQLSLYLAVMTLVSCTIANLMFWYGVVIPMGKFFDIRLARFAFNLPFLIAPIVWGYGMLRFHRRFPSKSLMLSLGLVGVGVYTLLPFIQFFAVMAYSGGYKIR